MVTDDLDGDKLPDLLAPLILGRDSRVLAFSSKSGKAIKAWSREGNNSFGSSIAVVPRCGASGTPSVVIGSPEPRIEDQSVLIFDLETKKLLSSLTGFQANKDSPPCRRMIDALAAGHGGFDSSRMEIERSGFGRTVACIGDVNGDSVDDVLVGMTNPSSSLEHVVWIFSGKDFSVMDVQWRLDERMLTAK